MAAAPTMDGGARQRTNCGGRNQAASGAGGRRTADGGGGGGGGGDQRAAAVGASELRGRGATTVGATVGICPFLARIQ